MSDIATGTAVSHRPRPCARIPAIAMAAAAVGTALLLAAASGTGPGLRALGDSLGVAQFTARPSPYRYHFSRPPQGAITSLLRDETPSTKAGSPGRLKAGSTGPSSPGRT